MSGGSWDYFYRDLADVVDRLEESDVPRRRALAAYLKGVPECLHAIEWRDSGDWGQDQEDKVLDRFLGADVVHRSAAEIIREAITRLEAALPRLT